MADGPKRAHSSPDRIEAGMTRRVRGKRWIALVIAAVILACGENAQPNRPQPTQRRPQPQTNEPRIVTPGDRCNREDSGGITRQGAQAICRNGKWVLP